MRCFVTSVDPLAVLDDVVVVQADRSYDVDRGLDVLGYDDLVVTD